jgi:hypothetical protein
MEDTHILRIEKIVMLRMLQEQPRFAEAFLSYLPGYHTVSTGTRMVFVSVTGG